MANDQHLRVGIPAAMQAEWDAQDAAMAKLADGAGAGAEPEAAAQATAEVKPAAEAQAAAGAAAAEEVAGTETAAAVDEPAAEAAEATTDEDTFEKRYHSLKGKYTQETSRYKLDREVAVKRLAGQDAQVADLQAQLAALKAERAKPAPTVAPTADELETSPEYLTLVEENGEKAAQAQLKLTRALAARTQESVAAAIAPVAQTQAQTKSLEFVGRLYAALPGLKPYDVDGSPEAQELMDWLGEGNLAAFHRFKAADDTASATALCERFLRSRGQPGTKAKTGLPSAHLEHRVLPRGATGTAPTTEATPPKRYTLKEITALYDKYSLDFSAAGALAVAELDKAVADGRVVA